MPAPPSHVLISSSNLNLPSAVDCWCPPLFRTLPRPLFMDMHRALDIALSASLTSVVSPCATTVLGAALFTYTLMTWRQTVQTILDDAKIDLKAEEPFYVPDSNPTTSKADEDCQERDASMLEFSPKFTANTPPPKRGLNPEAKEFKPHPTWPAFSTTPPHCTAYTLPAFNPYPNRPVSYILMRRSREGHGRTRETLIPATDSQDLQCTRKASRNF